MPLLDAHAHVWDPRSLPIDWVAGTPLDGPRLPSALADGVTTAWIFVEADVRATPLEEVAWVESLAWPGLAGIVADIDLAHAAADLEALGARPLVRGVRHLLQSLRDEVFADPAVREGLRAVGAAGLAFDACVRFEQLDALCGLVDAAPETTIILDHCGKPPVDAGPASVEGRQWRAALKRLAERPTVRAKLSGLRGEASTTAAFDAHALAFLAETIAAFGPERCLYGSDWPVSTGRDAGLETTRWAEMVRAASGSAWDGVAHANARDAYRIR
ncbi:amidohydrolase family protein [Microbacterium excoecariae]|uniref:amidohydrolase family protein n=1 Tax=Microbacterium excoecariae TaxID=2715210 RepID=UPI00140C79AC|nr:amidohydrolase family protein [Microbacterium excoecariae]NHI17783.1 amidohydrolase family protein [Microbacterium excoecariae]